MSDIEPARRLGAIQADVIDIRATLRRRNVPEEVLEQIWNLTNEAFRRGCEYAVEQKW